ncbi:MAG: alpha/beta hydrolase [Rhizobiaceae bacterium]
MLGLAPSPSNRSAAQKPREVIFSEFPRLTLDLDGAEISAQGEPKICREFFDTVGLEALVGQMPQASIYRDGLILSSKVGETIRLAFIDCSKINELLEDISPYADFSSAERAILLQLLSGISLREAANVDEVSYETKRSQFKSLAARTGLRTQSDVIRVFLLNLFMNISTENKSNRIDHTSPDGRKECGEFLETYYPGTFRRHEISTRNCRNLRIIEAGPVSGIPIIYLHSQTLPQPKMFTSGWLAENNIRLIIPLRPGFLDKDSTRLPIQKHLQRSTQDVAEAIELFCEGNAKVVTHSTGSAYAINLCRNLPKSVAQLTISGAAYVGSYENGSVANLVSGLKNVAAKSSFLTEQVYQQHLRKMGTKSGFQTIINSAYGTSPPDAKIFQDIFESPQGHSWIYETYQLSKNSIVNDILMPSLDVWKNVEDVQTPTLFLHGRQDPVNSVSAAKMIESRFPNSNFVELELEGQSLFLSRFEEMIANRPEDWMAR